MGASRELKRFFKENQNLEDIRDLLIGMGVEWKFIPPHSPNFGGLWEAGIKSARTLIKRVLRNTILNFEELTALLCQVKSCLNSRPLCFMSSDPGSLCLLSYH